MLAHNCLLRCWFLSLTFGTINIRIIMNLMMSVEPLDKLEASFVLLFFNLKKKVLFELIKVSFQFLYVVFWSSIFIPNRRKSRNKQELCFMNFLITWRSSKVTWIIIEAFGITFLDFLDEAHQNWLNWTFQTKVHILTCNLSVFVRLLQSKKAK